MKQLNFLFEHIAEYRPGKARFPGVGNPDDFEKAWAYWHLASAIARKKKYARASAYFEKAILEYPHCSLFYFTLAGCYARLDQTREALSCFKIAFIKTLRRPLSANSKREKNERIKKHLRVLLKPMEASIVEKLLLKQLPEMTMFS
jgi:tetratricopeptide (TPR) repeat protein